MTAGITKDDLRELIDEVTDKQKGIDTATTNSNINSMLDNVTKVLIAVITAGIIWLIQTTSTLQRENIEIKAAQVAMKEDLEELKEFTKQPRFTREDYLREIASVQQMVDLHTRELSSDNGVIDKIEDELSRLRGEMDLLKQKMENE